LVDFKDKNIKKLLIRGVNWVGDSVLTMPAVELARKIFPGIHIGMVVQEKLRPLWEGYPFIDEVIAYRKRKGPGALIDEMKLIKKLKDGKWDMAILFPNSFHSALTLFLARIPLRIGYDRDHRGFLLTERCDVRKGTLQKHQVEYYLDLVRNLADSQEVFPLPIIHVREDKIRWAQGFLGENGVRKGDLLIGISPGAAYGSAKRWFPERYAELIEKLLAHKVKVILLGGEEEKPFLDYLKSESNQSVVDAIGKTDLIQLAALLY
jgi:heptosyltransferase-2